MSNRKNSEGTFGEHLEALRPHLLRGAAMLAVMFVAAFIAKRYVVDGLLMGPMKPDFPTNRLLARLAGLFGADALYLNRAAVPLVNTSMAGQLNLHLKAAFFTAAVVSLPYIVAELWSFVRPALTEREARGCRMFALKVSLCFLFGAAFGYMAVAPLAVSFLSGYSASAAVSNMIDVNSYLSTVIDVTLACGVIFQLPLAVKLLARAGLLTPAFMRRYRRHAFMILALLAVVITPPDIVSALLVIAPLFGLYELSVSIAAREERRRAAGS